MFLIRSLASIIISRSLATILTELHHFFPIFVGLYKNGRFSFTFRINQNYPHDAPKVKCNQIVRLFIAIQLLSRYNCDNFFLTKKKSLQLYHPNLDLEGNVCLNILREDWKPVLNLHAVIIGLQYLFLEPNTDDPLNKGSCFHCRINTSSLIFPSITLSLSLPED